MTEEMAEENRERASEPRWDPEFKKIPPDPLNQRTILRFDLAQERWLPERGCKCSALSTQDFQKEFEEALRADIWKVAVRPRPSYPSNPLVKVVFRFRYLGGCHEFSHVVSAVVVWHA